MVLATIFNFNGGVRAVPNGSCCSASSLWSSTVVVGFIADVPDPGACSDRPQTGHTDRRTWPQVIRWLISGLVVAVAGSLILDLGPDKPSTNDASISMTMAFAFIASPP